MWISGPITTVHDEHICHELTAVARISLATRRWLSETSRSAAVVLGNHPISVRRTEGWRGSHLCDSDARFELMVLPAVIGSSRM